MRLPRAFALVRWKYVAPRAALVGAIALTVHFGLDPFLKWVIISIGKAALGAKVEVAEVETSVPRGKLVIRGIAAANPKKPMRNLLEAEQLHLRLDGGSLLRNRVVIRDGEVRGIRFDAPRTTSGALESAPGQAAGAASIFDPVVDAAGDSTSQWFDGLSGRIEQDLEAKLQTPRVADELEDRWSQQYESLKTKVESFGAQGKQFERDLRELRENPLRNLGQLDALRQQLAAVENELRTTTAVINALPAQAQANREAIDAARRQDEQFLRDALKIGQTDGDELSKYLLGDEANGYLSQTVWWVQTVRHFIPKSKMSRPARARGVNVLFVNRPRPRMLIERVRVEGIAQCGGEIIALKGKLTDLASEPECHERPARLHLTGAGAVPCDLVVELDRRGQTPHDSLVLDCPRLALPARTLGKPDRLALAVAPGDASLRANVKLDGDVLSGVIEFKQASSLAAATSTIRDDRIAQVLHESLAGIDGVEAQVRLAGTLQRPEWRLESNLGPQLAAGVNEATRRYLTDRKDRLVAKVRGSVDEQLAKLDAKRQAAQHELLAKLGDQQQLVSQLAAMATGKPPLGASAVPQLGRSLGLDKLTK